MPLSGGPSLIFASAPASWQGMHHLRNAASSCASALPADATTSNEANIQVFIPDLLSTSSRRRRSASVFLLPCSDPSRGGHPQLFEWRLARNLSTALARNLLSPGLISIGGARLRLSWGYNLQQPPVGGSP